MSFSVYPTHLQFDEQATAPSTPPAGTIAVYAKNDGKFYRKDDTGTEYEIGDSSGGAEFDVGDIKASARVADIANRWLRADGRTIGSGASGATARANADMELLFTHLWDNFNNTVLVIQDSSGSPTTRGASASADFSANKRMPLLDLRGRVLGGMDDPTGSNAANRVTNVSADVLGGSMGTETHPLTTSEMPAHTHGAGSGNSFINGQAAAGTTYRNDSANAGTFSANTASTGGGNAHNNIQPTLWVNCFIFTGNSI